MRKKRPQTIPAPSRTDLEILSVLWDRDQMTAREVHEALLEKGVIRANVAYTTVRTYLDRLIHKGYARSEESGDPRGTLIYRAAVKRDVVRNHSGVFERIVGALGMGLPEVALWFVQQKRVTQKDKQAVEDILKDIPDGKRPPG